MSIKDYPAEYDEEQLDNQYFAKAFPDAKGLGDLYRQTYKYTACGPYMGAKIQYIKVLEPDGFDEYPHEQEVTEWVHSDDLYRLGSWSDMDAQGILVTALMVGSIVEGVDHGADEHEIEAKQLDEEPRVQTQLYSLSPDELALLLAYRECCEEHRKGLFWFARASSSRCTDHLPANVCRFVKPK